MPCCDLDSHHDKLVEYKDGITDSNHLFAIDFGENLRKTLNHATLVYRDEHPDEKGTVGERTARREFFVEFGVQIGQVFVHILVENKTEHGSCSVHSGIANKEPILWWWSAMHIN